MRKARLLSMFAVVGLAVTLICMIPILEGRADAAAATPFKVLYSFDPGEFDTTNGFAPLGSFTLSGTALYGMTTWGGKTDVFSGGWGTIFKFDLQATDPFTLLYSFKGLDNQSNPDAGHPYYVNYLTPSGTVFYGMSQWGGENYATNTLGQVNKGTIFMFDPNATINPCTVLHSFGGKINGTDDDGAQVYGDLTLSGTALYGATNAGGTNPGADSLGQGTIFKFDTILNTYAILHDFAGYPGDAGHPNTGSFILSGTNLYGTSWNGGAHLGDGLGMGTIFKFDTKKNVATVLHSFAGGPGPPVDGAYPVGGLILSGTTLYGMTYYGGANYDSNNINGMGTIFKFDTTKKVLTVLHSFAGGADDGAHPLGRLILSGTTLYGTTYVGGADNLGTVFMFDTKTNAFTLLHSFAGGTDDGAHPTGSLTLVGKTLYGMTSAGGAFSTVDQPNGGGTIFSMASQQYVVTALMDSNSDAISNSVDAMNDKGELVGTMSDSQQHWWSFKFSAGLITELNDCRGSGYNRSINNSGMVACTRVDINNNNPHAISISAAGQQKELGTLKGWDGSEAEAINDSGEVVGYSIRAQSSTPWMAPVYFTGGSVHDLGMPKTCTWGNAYGINKTGHIFGEYSGPGGAFFYKGKFIDMGLTNPTPNAMNNSDQIVGDVDDAVNTRMAFIYSNGKATKLNAFVSPGSPGQSHAYGINDHGQVIGEADAANCNGNPATHAFVYDPGTGIMTDLNKLNTVAFGGCSSAAYAINNNGDVVGKAQTADGTYHAFLYSGGQMTDLNTLVDPNLGITLNAAFKINSAGQIIAVDLTNDAINIDLSYLLTPPSLVYTISGALKTSAKPPASIAGVTMTLSRGASLISTLTSDINGAYSFGNLLNGSYTVTPTKAGYTFAPTSVTVTLNGKGIIENFTGTPVTISGIVTPFKGKLIPSNLTVTVNLKDLNSGTGDQTCSTTISGNYEFDAVDGQFTVTPVPPQTTHHSGSDALVFVPPPPTVTVHGKNTKLNFHYQTDATCKGCH